MPNSTVSTQPASAQAEEKGLASRVIGVLMSPRQTYADVAAHPRWFGILAAVLVVAIVPVVLLLSTEVGQRAVVDQQIQTLESFGRTVNDAQYQQIQAAARFSRYIAGAFQLVGLPLATLAIAGVAFAIFNGVLGGNAAFKQIFSVVAHSGIVTALRAVFSAPLDYARETLSSPTSLSALFPVFADNTFVGRLLGSIDLFLIWWIVSLAIGLGVLYKRRTTPIATTMLVVYGALALAMAAIRSMLAGA